MGFQKKVAKFWGCSSVGRAPALQAGGRQFEPDQLHQNKEAEKARTQRETPSWATITVSSVRA